MDGIRRGKEGMTFDPTPCLKTRKGPNEFALSTSDILFFWGEGDKIL
jgi:hypothetical protein